MTFQEKQPNRSGVSVWDHEAVSYDESRRNDPVYISCIAAVTQSIPRGTALCVDAGCGTGLSTAALSGRCAAVIAVDYSLMSLKRLKDKGLQNVIAVQADLLALPFRDNAFDACVCANALQQMTPDGAQARVVSELKRITKGHGMVSVSVHHFSRAKRKAGWIKEGKPGQPGIDYIFRFTPKEVRALLPRARIKGVGYYGLLKVPLLGSRMQNVFGHFFGRMMALLGHGHMLVAVATSEKAADDQTISGADTPIRSTNSPGNA